jgi:molecular chaperone HtpG
VTDKQPQSFDFKTEARQLLDLMINSLYSNKEVFLRELISNASDALDRRRVEALTDASKLPDGTALEIRIETESEGRRLTIADTGVGMSREELIENLGTIAHSGTRSFSEELDAVKKEGDLGALIGRFGVGFYSSFMVAKRVEVVTRRAGTEEAWRFSSAGDGSYEVAPAERELVGTTITLELREVDEDNHLPDFCDQWILRQTIKKYSDFIQHPILLKTEREDVERDEEGNPKEETRKTRIDWVTVNSMKAIWMRPASELDEKAYQEFYRHLTHDWSDPLESIQLKAEGTFEYYALLFIPSRPPFDLFYRDAQFGLRLYSNRVMVMEQSKDLLPDWLRFVKGVVDSPDISLNVSREILQQDRRLGAIRKRLVKKVLDSLEKMKTDKPEEYGKFWLGFGRLLKEGAVGDHEQRERLRKLLWFESSATLAAEPPAPEEDEGDDEKPEEEKKEALVAPRFTSLEDYVSRMKAEQEEIYYINGESRAALERSPHVEALLEKGYEVIFLSDPYDEIMMSSLGEFEGKKFKSVGKGEVELGTAEEKEAAKAKLEQEEKEHAELLKLIKEKLEAHVSEVRLSARLTRSPSCLVGEEGDYSPHFRALLKRMGQDKLPERKRILEVNSGHPLFVAMKGRFETNAGDPLLGRAVEVLYHQAVLAEGSQLADPVEFAHKLSALMLDLLSADAKA